MLESFGERLKVISPTKTRVLAVEFTSRSLDLAARSPRIRRTASGSSASGNLVVARHDDPRFGVERVAKGVKPKFHII